MPVILKSTSYGEKPKNAIAITRDEAAQLIYDEAGKLGLLKALPLRGSLATVIGVTGVTAVLLVTKIRQKLKLGKYGFFTMAIPALYVPMVGNYVMYKKFFTPPLLLQENICLACLEIKAMAIHSAIAVGYPVAMGFVCSYLTATGIGTIVAPPLKYIRYAASRAEMYTVLKTTTQVLAKPLVYSIVANCVVASLAIWIHTRYIDQIVKDIEIFREENVDRILKEEAERQIHEWNMAKAKRIQFNQ